MAYVFSYTSRDAQTYLHQRYREELADPFTSKEEIVDYLSSIYKDPFKVQNACLNYKVFEYENNGDLFDLLDPLFIPSWLSLDSIGRLITRPF